MKNDALKQWSMLLNQISLQEEIAELRAKGLTEEEILGYIEFADIIVKELLAEAGLE